MLKKAASLDPWDAILASIAAGTYATDYAINDLIPITVGTATFNMQIVAFNADPLASDSSKTAAISFVSEQMVFKKRMNGSSAAWPNTELRTYLRGTYLDRFPANVKAAIKEVTKTYYDSSLSATQSGSDTIWLPSLREVNYYASGLTREDSGPNYSSAFPDNASRKKTANGFTSTGRYWLRSNPYSSSM